MLGSRLSNMAKAPHLSVSFFHAHVYFDASTANVAQLFQQRMKQEWNSRQVRVHELHHQPIGPHPLPMFEAGFSREVYTDFLTWLQFERPEELPVLIHPYTDEMVADHTRRALWLGQQLPGPHAGIRTGILEQFEARSRGEASSLLRLCFTGDCDDGCHVAATCLDQAMPSLLHEEACSF